MNLSIRLRLTLWYSAVLLAALALFAAAMSVALEHRLTGGVDTRLAERVDGLRTVAEEGTAEKMSRAKLQEELVEFTEQVPEGELTLLKDGTGLLLEPPRGFPARFDRGRPRASTVTVNGRRYRMLVTRFESGTAVYEATVFAGLSEVETVLGGFRLLLLWLAPAVLCVACFGGYWVSRRALRPVDQITRVARSITLQNLSARLEVPRTGDELQRMSETWNEVLERLEDSVRRIRRFTADASHELRTPLALIQGTAELALRRERSGDDYRRSLASIQAEASRMTELTEALLALARSDNGLGMPLGPVDVARVATEVMRQYDPLAAAGGITLTSGGANAPISAIANAAGLRRLIAILLDNALKFTPAGGQVTVTTELVPEGVRLVVADTGEGIAPEALPHIFERFYRGDAARSGGSGTGLGLSIAQAIAQANGTEITVASRPGEGARFEIILKSPGMKS